MPNPKKLKRRQERLLRVETSLGPAAPELPHAADKRRFNYLGALDDGRVGSVVLPAVVEDEADVRVEVGEELVLSEPQLLHNRRQVCGEKKLFIVIFWFAIFFK